MTETTAAAQDLMALQAYQLARPHIFPSDHALRWYVRQHRAELIDAGILVVVANRYLVGGSKLDEFVLRQGKASAHRFAA